MQKAQRTDGSEEAGLRKRLGCKWRRGQGEGEEKRKARGLKTAATGREGRKGQGERKRARHAVPLQDGDGLVRAMGLKPGSANFDRKGICGDEDWRGRPHWLFVGGDGV